MGVGRAIDVDIDIHLNWQGMYLYVCEADLLAKPETTAERHCGVKLAMELRTWG